MGHVFEHALTDSLQVIIFVLLFNVLLSFFENFIINKLLKNDKKVNSLTGALFGLIPQCGVSVLSADLYVKEHVSMGTIVAVFIACSDEAVTMILSDSNKVLTVLPLLLLKFVIGFVVGFFVDLLYHQNTAKIKEHHKVCQHQKEIKIGCCHHEINNDDESKLHRHLIHPLLHTLKLFVYIFAINLLFGTIIYFIGEESFINILQNNKYFTPVYAIMIGLIPNCVSSVIITDLYIMGRLSFGTTLAGLITNAGLGLVVLLKNKNMIKKTIVIIAILVLTALVSGYVINLIFGF